MTSQTKPLLFNYFGYYNYFDSYENQFLKKNKYLLCLNTRFVFALINAVKPSIDHHPIQKDPYTLYKLLKFWYSFFSWYEMVLLRCCSSSYFNVHLGNSRKLHPEVYRRLGNFGQLQYTIRYVSKKLHLLLNYTFSEKHSLI